MWFGDGVDGLDEGLGDRGGRGGEGRIEWTENATRVGTSARGDPCVGLSRAGRFGDWEFGELG